MIGFSWINSDDNDNGNGNGNDNDNSNGNGNSNDMKYFMNTHINVNMIELNVHALPYEHLLLFYFR